jgi:hypothetical protein
MVTVNSLQEYRKVQQMRINKLKSMKRKTTMNAAKYMSAVARRLAPKDTGNLLRGIVRRGNQVRISATNPVTGFPYVKWINASPGYERVAYRVRWTSGRDRRKYAYSEVMNRTGTPRFVTIAANSARQFYNNIAITETRKAINLTG